jgi:hypothetical protein
VDTRGATGVATGSACPQAANTSAMVNTPPPQKNGAIFMQNSFENPGHGASQNAVLAVLAKPGERFLSRQILH